jgi:hypothetical protein
VLVVFAFWREEESNQALAQARCRRRDQMKVEMPSVDGLASPKRRLQQGVSGWSR